MNTGFGISIEDALWLAYLALTHDDPDVNKWWLYASFVCLGTDKKFGQNPVIKAYRVHFLLSRERKTRPGSGTVFFALSELKNEDFLNGSVGDMPSVWEEVSRRDYCGSWDNIDETLLNLEKKILAELAPRTREEIRFTSHFSRDVLMKKVRITSNRSSGAFGRRIEFKESEYIGSEEVILI